MFAMRQSAELFGVMSHRFQIDESEIRERISYYDFSKNHGTTGRIRTPEKFAGLMCDPYNFGDSELGDMNSNELGNTIINLETLMKLEISYFKYGY